MPGEEPCFHPLPQRRRLDELLEFPVTLGRLEPMKLAGQRERRQARLGTRPVSALDLLSGRLTEENSVSLLTGTELHLLGFV